LFVIRNNYYNNCYYKIGPSFLSAMSSYSSFRTKIHIGQSRLAKWLGVSQSLVNLAEAQKRKLPTKAEILFIQFNQLLDSIKNPDSPWPGLSESTITFPKKTEDFKRKQQTCERDIQQLRKLEMEIVQRIEHQETALAFGKRVLETDIVLENPRLKELLGQWFEEVRLDYAEEGPRALKGIRFQLGQKQRELDFLAEALLDYAPGPY
jgi:hypothetical protein